MSNELKDQKFKKRIAELVGDEYTFLGEYEKRHAKIKCKHNVCGYVWDVEAGAFLGNKNKKGSRCPSCYGNVIKTTEVFSKEVEEATNREYKLVSKYINARTEVEVEHSKCGNTFRLRPNTFLCGGRCPVCNPARPYNQERAEDRIRQETNERFTLVSDYVGCYEPITLKHEACGNTIEITMQSVDQNRINCNYCFNRSIGEVLVANYLEKEGIKFEPQKRFEGFKRYSFDFFLPELDTVIEYHGLQHYKPIEFFGGVKGFDRQVVRDNRKEKFSLDNNYRFLEVSYVHTTQKSVNSILDSFLK